MKFWLADLVLGVQLRFWECSLTPLFIITSLVGRIFARDYAATIALWVLEKRLLPLAQCRFVLCYGSVISRIDYLIAGKDL